MNKEQQTYLRVRDGAMGIIEGAIDDLLNEEHDNVIFEAEVERAAELWFDAAFDLREANIPTPRDPRDACLEVLLDTINRCERDMRRVSQDMRHWSQCDCECVDTSVDRLVERVVLDLSEALGDAAVKYGRYPRATYGRRGQSIARDDNQ